jgi:predicted 3-demethylubiquinone-9 3-methyltransferase (glyoxalase superfamily)
MQKISPCLWFDSQAEDAAKFYVSVFKNSKITAMITAISHYGESGPGPAGSVMTIAFELDGQDFTALNGGPYFKLNEAVSFMVDCADQAEVDHYWNALIKGGQPSQCGWLKDRFGLSWQVVPRIVGEVLSGSDPAKANRVMAAVMQMVKLDVAKLEAAANG